MHPSKETDWIFTIHRGLKKTIAKEGKISLKSANFDQNDATNNTSQTMNSWKEKSHRGLDGGYYHVSGNQTFL